MKKHLCLTIDEDFLIELKKFVNEKGINLSKLVQILLKKEMENGRLGQAR
jgi:antitoxin component of RelBE/YafQ-DinJ toxin-antitoxin module